MAGYNQVNKTELSSEISPAHLSATSGNNRTTLWQNIALALLGPMVLLGLLEGIAYAWERRQADSQYAWELVASRRMVWEEYLAPGTGFTLMKPGSQYEWQGIPVDINSQGLRGPETTFEKPPATYRILNLGDSVVMGWGVREDDTYGRRLESLLNENNVGNLKFEVINAGVPGWNLENASAFLQAKGFQYEPDLIVLGLTIANDIKGDSALLADNYPPLVKWFRDNTYFWPFLTVQFRWLEARAQGRERIDIIDPPTNPDKYFPPDPKAEQWMDFWGQVSDIHRLALERDIPIVLVLLPLEFQVIDDRYPTLAQEVLTSKAKETGIPAVDVLPAFRRACQEKPEGACQREDRFLFADVWMHPSAAGHELIALELEAYLAPTIED